MRLLNPKLKKQHVKIIRCHFTSDEYSEIAYYLKYHHLTLEEALKEALVRVMAEDFDEMMIRSYHKMSEDEL
jgi:hypothetical protein